MKPMFDANVTETNKKYSQNAWNEREKWTAHQVFGYWIGFSKWWCCLWLEDTLDDRNENECVQKQNKTKWAVCSLREKKKMKTEWILRQRGNEE